MKNNDDPRRLLDPASHASPALRAVLDAAPSGLPGDAQLQRLARRLPLGPGPDGGAGPGREGGGGPGAQAPGGAAGRGAAGSNGAVGKASPASFALPSLGLVGAALVGAALAITVVYRPPPPASPLHEAAAARAPGPAAQSAPAEPPPRRADPESSVPESPTAAVAPAPSTASEPAPRASAAPPEGESEIALLKRAQDALGADPARALALTDEHLARFPRGTLGQERELIIVSALVRVGRMGEARARAARFIARYPTSAHRRRLEAILPGEPEPKPAAPLPPAP